MALGKKTGGRKKGTPNKVTTSVRQDIMAVHMALGGTAAMLDWAKDNQTEFYRHFSKMAVGDPDAPGTETNPLVNRVENVIVDAKG